jgi:hypothetical protein
MSMATRTLLVLAELSFELGLIDVTEYDERHRVARWMAADESSFDFSRDPREPPAPEGVSRSRDDEHAEFRGSGNLSEPGWIELLVLGRWLFTKSDPDTYPSTPHGHLQSANREWPKLNPYTGRVFKAKHQEDAALRLSKKEMQCLWRDHAFRDFCRSYILLYIEVHPHYAFRAKKPLRFPRW